MALLGCGSQLGKLLFIAVERIAMMGSFEDLPMLA
jgi:hypothetical protein